ncbi:MAG: hypothetical protein Q7J98_02830 [Kiritimatiellia bacterium]|nr:hypothetical protein [Kiritimatiellia bacterium]
MSSDSGKEQSEKNVLHLDEAERVPHTLHGLPAVPGSSSSEVVKQIIEQILANERRRARMEFVRLSVFFLVFLFVMLGAGIWFARQLLSQLREERQLTEQTWRMMAGGGGGPRDSSASIQEMLQHQQNAIQALNARLNEVQDKTAGASAAPEETRKIDFISAPIAENTKLRMPIPSL